jgi:hypothetical protein
MADFLITARISAPDGILAQAQALAKIADPVGVLGKALEEAGFGPVKVEVIRGRALAAPQPADPAKPKRERKAKAPPATKARASDLIGYGGMVDASGALVDDAAAD